MDTTEKSAHIGAVAMVGNHAPRQCGIATFTTDLAEAITRESPGTDCFVLAVNDEGQSYDYPDRVRFAIDERELGSYRRACDFLHVGGAEVVSLQHEYGIFGGVAGSNVVALLGHLNLPVVTTLHTVLEHPSAAQRSVMDAVTRLSERVVIMSDHGADLLRAVHGVASSRIDVIPHGIPDLPFDLQTRGRFGLDGKPVILTFGLLSPDKGIEWVIDALPDILAEHPDTVYLVVGATHPHVLAEQGEAYRAMLLERAARRGVGKSVIFHNRFVSQAELTDFLGAADIYVTPYLNPEQITSGTLAYAVGAGKAVLSTPYRYARGLLAEGRGVLLPWHDADPGAIAREVSALLRDDARRLALRTRAWAHGRGMVWPAVARAYLDSFARARRDHSTRVRSGLRARMMLERPGDLPEVPLEHLRLLSDSTGILQHAAFGVPRYEDGYCLDDNARALMLTAQLAAAGSEPDWLPALASRYLAFVRHAFQPDSGRFRNFMTFARQFTEEQGSEDSHGRAVWALGTVVGRAREAGRPSLAGDLFHRALAMVPAFHSPRAWAFVLLGIDEYLVAFRGDRRIEALRSELAGRLLRLLGESSAPDWPWFEDRLTYENARMAQALVVSGQHMNHPTMLTLGLRSLDWLSALERSREGDFAPVGSNGFHDRGGPRALFDQQPVEAYAMISASLAAAQATGNRVWHERARRAFRWFLGQNQVQRPLFDPSTGGCRDGLHSDRANENQGAESTLSYLLSLVELRAAQAREPAHAAPLAAPIVMEARWTQ